MRRNLMTRPAIVLTATGLVVALTACGNAAESGLEQLIESQGGGNVDLDLDGDGGFSMQTEEGGMTIDEDGNFVITDADGQVVTGDVDTDGGGINVESEDGSFSSGATTELPEQWPSEIPDPNGLAIASASVIGSDSDQAITVSGSVDGEEFVENYGAALQSAGFEEQSTFKSEGTINNTYTDGTWTVSVGYFGDASGNQAPVSLFSG